MAVAAEPAAMLSAPSAVARSPVAFAFAPTAAALFETPVEALVPRATAFVPLAWAFAPQPKDDADADAPLLLPVTELATGMVVVVAVVRMFAVVTLTPLTNAALAGVTLVIALLEGVVRVAPFNTDVVVVVVPVRKFPV